MAAILTDHSKTELFMLVFKKQKKIIYKKRPRLASKSSVFEWSIPAIDIYGTHHSKTEPFDYRLLKRLVIEWIRYSNVRNSSPDCIFFISCIKTLNAKFGRNIDLRKLEFLSAEEIIIYYSILLNQLCMRYLFTKQEGSLILS